MANMIRLRNTGRRTELVYVGSETVTVVPGGTLLVPEDHSIRSQRVFRPVTGTVKPRTANEQDLQTRIEELEALLAAQKAGAAPEAPAEEPAEASEGTYPQYQPGGKWTLSDGTVTKGGTSRERAEELEAALHEE